MLYLGLLKRIVPFALTFAAGLLVASFFVSVALPSFGTRGRKSRCHKHRIVMQENAELKDEIRRLNEQLASASSRSDWYHESLESVPAPAIPDLPPPPSAKDRGHGCGYAERPGRKIVR